MIYVNNKYSFLCYCACKNIAKKVSAVERQLKKEEEILEIVAEKKALMGVSELAKGIQYNEPIKTRLGFLYLIWITSTFIYI